MGSTRLTCGRPSTQPSYTQLTPKREDVTQTLQSWQPSGLRGLQVERDLQMAVQADPYLSAYLRKPRIPDTVAAPDPGDQSKTILPRRRPRVPKDLDAGPLEAEVGSFALHMAAEGKAPRTIRNYIEAVRWFAAACILTETDKRRWEEVDKAPRRGPPGRTRNPRAPTRPSATSAAAHRPRLTHMPMRG